ncbi:pilus assembly protein PilM [Vibrio sp. DNB22_10_4]
MARKWITGIDIGHHSAKAVVLVCDGTDISLVNHLELKGCDAIFSDPHALKHQDSVKKLKILRKIAPLFRSSAAIVLPESAVISKVVTLEAGLEGQEQELAIEQAMNHQTPYPMDDIALDFIKETEEDNVAVEAYRVHVTKQSIVDSWSHVITKLGFRPKLMDTNNGALRGVQSWVCAHTPSLANHAVLDLGCVQATLLPPPALSPELAKSWVLEPIPELQNRAESQFKSLSEVVFESVAGRVASQLQLYRSVAGKEAIDGVILMGGHAQQEGVIDRVTKALSCPIACIDLQRLSTSKTKSGQALSPCYASAVGAAINGLNWLKRH